MAIIDQGKVQKEISRDNTDGGDHSKQRKVKNKACPYVPAVFALTKVDMEHPPTFQQLLEVQYLDPECRLTLKEVAQPQSDITMDTKGLVIRVAPLYGVVQINISAVYHLVIY